MVKLNKIFKDEIKDTLIHTSCEKLGNVVGNVSYPIIGFASKHGCRIIGRYVSEKLDNRINSENFITEIPIIKEKQFNSNLERNFRLTKTREMSENFLKMNRQGGRMPPSTRICPEGTD